ncbi:peptidase S33, tripeptidyl-peptidase [Thozetella sp. PMI_491]|nr:peptidase S33, tripeptidyl-peptidase [Thozetella sp. PMI_491]
MKRYYYCLLTALFGSTALANVHASPLEPPNGGTADFDWSSVAPSHQLEYHACYEGYQCARLLLPLDWLDDLNEEIVAIAVIKLPAVVDDEDPSFGGTIVAQPGGPGQSGTQFCRGRGNMLRELIDIPGKKHYEIISFDPRGIGQSTPRIGCFSGISGSMRALEFMVNGAIELSPAALAFRLAAAKVDALQCETAHGNFLSYVGTPNVARDMLALVDKTEELRKQNAMRLKQVDDQEAQARFELRSTTQPGKEDEELPRLQYLGISYGTLLGNYFASMFPGRVGRMVLDGVCDADDYANEQASLTDGADADEIVSMFFQGCFIAGPSGCALHHPGDLSGADISRRFWIWADSLDMKPLVMPTDDGARVYMRAGEIRAVFYMALYDATYQSKALAVIFSNAMQGQTASLSQIYASLSGIKPPLDICSNSSTDPLVLLDSESAVTCLDGDDVTDRDESYWCDYLERQLSTSSLAGGFITTVRLPCSGWRWRPNWEFKGPFKTPDPSKSSQFPKSSRPAAPLLFMSNRYDPITPLRNARTMARSHPGAGVLVQESTGHCVIRGPMGPCVKKVVSEYFDTGTVPSEEVACEAMHGPWDV